MEIETLGSITVMRPDERLDALDAPRFKDQVKKAVENGSRKLVIDLEKTTFIDSSGCGALVASVRIISKNKGDMKIARPSQQARTLFGLTRLDRVFDIFEDLDQAIKSFS